MRTHGHHSTTPHPGSWSFRAGRSRLKPRQAQRYRCSLIYKLPILRMLGASARYSRLYVPVETSTPPCRRKVHFTRNTLSGIPRFISLLLHFQTNPLALGFARIDSGSHQELCRLQIRFIVVLCYPFKKSTKVYFVTSLLLARNFLLAFTVQFSRCKPLILFQDQIEMLGRLPKHFNLFLVEVTGLEPVTPCLQSKCSTS